MRIFVDTCVWRYWLALKNNRTFSNDAFLEDALYFDEIYGIVSRQLSKFLFLYNARIEQELSYLFSNELELSFSSITKNCFMEKIPIPISRADGTYSGDGSVLGGGHLGGALKGLLSLDGLDHEIRIQTARPNEQRKNQAHTKGRLKEFDIEHLESALEANADLFITSDRKTIIEPLKRAHVKYRNNPAIIRAYSISVVPCSAIQRM